jgi:hypothetical protein
MSVKSKDFIPNHPGYHRGGRAVEKALDLPARSRFGEGRAEPFIENDHPVQCAAGIDTQTEIHGQDYK